MTSPMYKRLRVWISLILALQGLVLVLYLSFIQTPTNVPSLHHHHDVIARATKVANVSRSAVSHLTNLGQSSASSVVLQYHGFGYMVLSNGSRGDPNNGTAFDNQNNSAQFNQAVSISKGSKKSAFIGSSINRKINSRTHSNNSAQYTETETFRFGLKLMTYLYNRKTYTLTSNVFSWIPDVKFRTNLTFTLRDGYKKYFHSFQTAEGQPISRCLPEGSKPMDMRIYPELTIITNESSTTSSNLTHSDSAIKLSSSPSPVANSTADSAAGPECQCKSGWLGRHCSIPDSVIYSQADKYLGTIRVRARPRRIMSALTFNMEFDLLETRFHELNDVVDVFIIYESNYTLYGDAKPLRLLERLLAGYLSEFHHKIVYLLNGKFPLAAKEEGWIPEMYSRGFLGKEGMKRVIGAKPDDLFIYTDADEIPSRESLLFFKLHDGYPEPFGSCMRWSVYGFFWRQSDATRITFGSTYGMFRYVFGHDAQKLRSGEYGGTASSELRTYIATGAILQSWLLAEDRGTSGWHCSWCTRPADIKIKLTSAINADFPRWGSYPEKLDLKYISNLIKTGTWFDDITKVGALVNSTTDDTFAPDYIMQHKAKYRHLLDIKEAG